LKGKTIKVDQYTKSILTVIAVAMVALVMQNFTTSAEAQFGGGSEMIVPIDTRHGVFQLRDSKVRYCNVDKCYPWIK
jgi:hypothetical protein